MCVGFGCGPPVVVPPLPVVGCGDGFVEDLLDGTDVGVGMAVGVAVGVGVAVLLSVGVAVPLGDGSLEPCSVKMSPVIAAVTVPDPLSVLITRFDDTNSR